MKRSAILWIGALAGALVLTAGAVRLAHFRRGAQQGSPAVLTVQPAAVPNGAPAFSAPDLQGQRVSLSGTRPNVILFMAPECSDCWLEEQNLKSLRAQFHAKARFFTVDINNAQNESQALAYVQKQFGGPWPHIVDAKGALMRAYGVTSLDTVFVVGPSPSHPILHRFVSPSLRTLQNALRQAT